LRIPAGSKDASDIETPPEEPGLQFSGKKVDLFFVKSWICLLIRRESPIKWFRPGRDCFSGKSEHPDDKDLQNR